MCRRAAELPRLNAGTEDPKVNYQGRRKLDLTPAEPTNRPRSLRKADDDSDHATDLRRVSRIFDHPRLRKVTGQEGRNGRHGGATTAVSKEHLLVQFILEHGISLHAEAKNGGIPIFAVDDLRSWRELTATSSTIPADPHHLFITKSREIIKSLGGDKKLTKNLKNKKMKRKLHGGFSWPLKGLSWRRRSLRL
ncbi:TPA: hypothetical protein DEA21_02885 [Candidatus Uhrbacteria bacterium]|nr:hypothetical protein [Candidatus Uhrbacteria bacterium]